MDRIAKTSATIFNEYKVIEAEIIKFIERVQIILNDEGVYPDGYEPNISHSNCFSRFQIKGSSVIVLWEYADPWDEFMSSVSELSIPIGLYEATEDEVVRYYREECHINEKEMEIQHITRICQGVGELKGYMHKIDLVGLLVDSLKAGHKGVRGIVERYYDIDSNR